MSLEVQALFGGTQTNHAISAQTLNPAYATSGTDWGAVLANGIRGAADGALSGMVGERFQNGQLLPPPGYYGSVSAGGDLLPLIVIGVIGYLIVKA